jgi:hypothetical protein
VPKINHTEIGILKSDANGTFISNSAPAAPIDGINTMPVVCIGNNGSFYVVYRNYNRLYSDYFNADGNRI